LNIVGWGGALKLYLNRKLILNCNNLALLFLHMFDQINAASVTIRVKNMKKSQPQTFDR